jgi:FkbM family methyltransferase
MCPLRRKVSDIVRGTLKECILEMPIATFFEIGACEASFSRNLLRSSPGIAVHCFEANPHNYARYRNEVTALGIGYHGLAISHHCGTTTLNVPRRIRTRTLDATNRQGSLLKRRVDDVSYEQITVQATDLDSWVLQNRAVGPYCLWLDVEGAQTQVLRGARSVLNSTLILFTEAETIPVWKDQRLADDLELEMEELGFVCALQDVERPRQVNLLMVRKDILPKLQAVIAAASRTLIGIIEQGLSNAVETRVMPRGE